MEEKYKYILSDLHYMLQRSNQRKNIFKIVRSERIGLSVLKLIEEYSNMDILQMKDTKIFMGIVESLHREWNINKILK